ncbi:MAG: hypothetical protein OIF40_09840, partial [Mangrovicoccus sp.]|nr:hypothetical protein [Mangrovicoccus sp.]
APIYGGVVMRGSDLGPKPARPGGRLHWELALQLSHLTQDPSWLSARGQALSRKIADLRASGEIGGMKPKTTQDFSNPHVRLSAEDCCKMLMEERDAPRVEYQAMEIEHSLGQRVAGLFDRITNWLGVPERAHQFNALNGVFDPANLRAVSPVQHFMVDGFAAFFYRPLRAGVFAPSARRLGQIKPNGQTAMLIPGRPYLAFQDPRKALDLAGDLTAALEQSRLGDRPKPKRQVSVESVAEAAKQEAKKITYAQKQRAAITRMADALTDLAAERKTRDVGLHEFLEAVHHAGADRAQNAFVAMDGAMLRDVITLAQTLPPASTLKPGYRQDQVRRFFEALIEAGSAINLDTGNLRQKL